MARAPRICTVHGCPETGVRLNRCRQNAAEEDRRREWSPKAGVEGLSAPIRRATSDREYLSLPS